MWKVSSAIKFKNSGGRYREVCGGREKNQIVNGYVGDHGRWSTKVAVLKSRRRGISPARIVRCNAISVLTYSQFRGQQTKTRNKARWIGLLIRLYQERTNSFKKHRAVQVTSSSSSSSLVCADRYLIQDVVTIVSSLFDMLRYLTNDDGTRRRHLMAILQLQIMKCLWIKVFYSYVFKYLITC